MSSIKNLRKLYVEGAENMVSIHVANELKSRTLLGPYSRISNVHLEETKAAYSLYKNIKMGVLIDVGAHHGHAFFPFLDNEWKVFAFEPDTKNRETLLKRLFEHRYKNNVILDNRAVSDIPAQEQTFYRSEESSGISSLKAFRATHKEFQTVCVTTLAESIPAAMTKVDFLKIDTEGFDFMVLKGIPWDRFKPAVIECEFEDAKSVPLGYTWKDMANYLLDKGYKIYVSEWHPVIRYGIRHQWCALHTYPCELGRADAWGNLFAVQPSTFDEQEIVEAFTKELIWVWKVHFRRAAREICKNPGKTSYYLKRYAKRFFLNHF